jgi:hypothetical protein
MDGALVGAGSLWLYKHTIAIYGYIPLNCSYSTSTARGLCPMWHPVHWIFLKEKFEFPLCKHDMACLITGKKQWFFCFQMGEN